jgi:hypothetical protein
VVLLYVSSVYSTVLDHGGAWSTDQTEHGSRWWEAFLSFHRALSFLNKVESGGGGAFLSFHRALSFFKQGGVWWWRSFLSFHRALSFLFKQGGVRWWRCFFKLFTSFELFFKTRWSLVVEELFEKLFTSFFASSARWRYFSKLLKLSKLYIFQ